jgi:hypothetical protein
MRVEVHKVTFSQLFSKAGADDLSSVKTENGINYSCVVIVGNQFLGNSLSLGKTGLLRRYVNIVIDVGVAGCEVTAGYAQKQIFFFCSDLIATCGRHIVSVPKKPKKPLFFNSITKTSCCQGIFGRKNDKETHNLRFFLTFTNKSDILD